MGNSASKAERLHDQGLFGISQFMKSGKPRELSLAVRLLGKAASVAAFDNDAPRALYLLDWGRYSGLAYERGAGSANVSDALRACEEAVALLGRDHKDYPQALVTWADVLTKRYQREEAVADLARAEELCKNAMRLTPAEHHDRSKALVALAHCLLAKFRAATASAGRQGVHGTAPVLDALAEAAQDMDRIMQCCQDCIEAAPRSGPASSRPVWACVLLSSCHLAKYEASLAPTSLNAAFVAARRGYDLVSGHPDAAIARARCLAARFRATRALRDIDEAITLGNAAAATAAAQADRLQLEECLCLLSDHYDAKFAITQDARSDLVNCIGSRRKLLSLLADGSVAQAHSLRVLCGLLWHQYRAPDSAADRDGTVLLQAIDTGEMGLAVPGSDAPAARQDRAQLLELLVSCYGAKLASPRLLKPSMAPTDLQRAIELGEEALSTMRPGEATRREKLTKMVRALKVDGAYVEAPAAHAS